MLYAKDTLNSLIGQVQTFRPNCSPTQAQLMLNFRMRQLYDSRPYWNSGITRGVLQIPAAYSTGTISTTTGSKTVTGVGTAWPVSDVVNTTIPTAILQTGNQTVQPASMTNINPDTWLYVDAGGNPEVVYVLDTTPQAFTAVFNFTHGASATATCSSLAGRTFRFGFQVPNFLITAVLSATNLLIELPFSGLPLTAVSYTILKNLYNFSPYLKELMSVVDPQQGIELTLNYPQIKLNQEDPQRTSLEFPQLVSPHSISPAGTQLFEIWPSPTAVRQLYFEYYTQPKDLTSPGDRPPAYLNPQVLVMGAVADAFRTKIGDPDPYFNPELAMVWEQRFTNAVDALIFADNSMNNQAYTWRQTFAYPSGANFDQSHDYDSYTGNW